MAINWFPGHMHKARKEIAEVMPQVDIIIELLDARIPGSSENPLVPALRGDRPCIKVLNKADLADPEVTAVWVTELEQTQGVTALPLSQQHPEEIRKLLAMCEAALPQRNLDKRNVRAMILGVPNVGKSTLINTLAGRVIAKTGNEAGITKAQQRIKLSNDMVLLDTPGFLWPKLNPPDCGYRLAVTGAIKDTVFDYVDIALFAADYLAKTYPGSLQGRYGLQKVPETDIEILEAIALQRSCMRKGGVVDLQKVAVLFITELRAGLLGRLTLETPEMIAREEAAARESEAQKKEEKQARDSMRRQRARKNRR